MGRFLQSPVAAFWPVSRALHSCGFATTASISLADEVKSGARVSRRPACGLAHPLSPSSRGPTISFLRGSRADHGPPSPRPALSYFASQRRESENVGCRVYLIRVLARRSDVVGTKVTSPNSTARDRSAITLRARRGSRPTESESGHTRKRSGIVKPITNGRRKPGLIRSGRRLASAARTVPRRFVPLPARRGAALMGP